MPWVAAFSNKSSGPAPIEISIDVFSESGETHDYLFTNAALAAGLPNVSRLAQEKITGRTADPIYLNRSHWTANDAGSRIGQSAGYNAQIGVDTTGWKVHDITHQLKSNIPSEGEHFLLFAAFHEVHLGTDTRTPDAAARRTKSS